MGRPVTRVKKNCLNCEKQFETYHGQAKTRKYCGYDCYVKSGTPIKNLPVTPKGTKHHNWSRVDKTCLNCTKSFQVSKYRSQTAKHCSFSCLNEYKVGMPPPNKGIPMREESKRKLSESKKGSIPHNKGKGDPANKFKQSMSKMISNSLKNKNGLHWETLAGYSCKELRRYLEARFRPGMSWDNYGEWHVDHIIPKSLFKYESYDDPEFKACWALENLQPLWAKDNLSKGNRITEEVLRQVFMQFVIPPVMQRIKEASKDVPQKQSS